MVSAFRKMYPMDRAALVLGLGFFVLLLLAGIWYHVQGEDVNQEIQKEDGYLENLTFLYFLFAGVIFLRAMGPKTSPVRAIFRRYRVLLILLGIACIVAALEEISYGQRIFGWESPEFFQDHSSQDETDFHNFEVGSVVFGIAAGCVVLGGFVIPFGLRYMPRHFNRFRDIFGIRLIFPPPQAAVVFGLALMLLITYFKTKYLPLDHVVTNEYEEYLYGFGFLLFSLYLHDPRYQKMYGSMPGENGKNGHDRMN